MGDWWYRNIIEPGKLPLLLALASFVLTFLTVRTITRMIRAGRGPFQDVTPGGVHVHHIVPGIILAVVGGFGAVASGGHTVSSSISAVLFGIGAGLTLDEFALVLYMADVYWSERGRQSVEVVVVTAALVGMVLCGFVPFGVDQLTNEEEQSRVALITTVLFNFLLSLIVLTKGKLWLALVGALVPLVALCTALRLARPDSPWARRFYRGRPRALARAGRRADRHDRRWSGPRRRLRALVAGSTDER